MQKITEAMKNNRAAFIMRLTSCLDDKNIPARGRKTKLAHLAGITPRAVYNWYNLTSGPSREHLTPIARCLQLEVDYLLSGTVLVPEGSVVVKPVMAGPNAQLVADVSTMFNDIDAFLALEVSPTERMRLISNRIEKAKKDVKRAIFTDTDFEWLFK
jgi:hypothetical protein